LDTPERLLLDTHWSKRTFIDDHPAPGVSHHEPGGLSVRQVVNILLSLDAPILGADVVELNPDRDIHGMTAVLAAKLVKELAAAMAANRFQ